MADGADSSDRYCADIVHTFDIDIYLCDLFLPAAIRDDVFAVHAFGAEIAAIGKGGSEPAMGEIRLQWWREVISGERDGEAQGSPVANQLLRVIEKYQLPHNLFSQMLDARAFDLYNDPMGDVNMLEGYAGETTSGMFQLVAIIASKASGDGAGHTECAGHAGVVWTIIRILKSLPGDRARQRCYIPAELLDRAGMSLEAYLSGQQGNEADKLIGQMVSLARQHLAEFRKFAADLQSGLPVAFLPMCLATPYFDRFERFGHRCLVEPIDLAQWRKQIMIWRAARRENY